MYRAMSIANAMRVRRAAMEERSDAKRASVTCEERESRRAIKVTAAAIKLISIGNQPRRRTGTCQLDAQLGHEWHQIQW
jgi:hypothetical protein